MKSEALKRIIAITVFAALAIPVRLAAQQQQWQAETPQHYTATDLGTLGGTSSYAGAVNNKGWADGAGNLPGDTTQHAVLWLKGSKIDLGTFGGPNSAVFGKGLNENGQVVGEAEITIPDPLGQDFC